MNVSPKTTNVTVTFVKRCFISNINKRYNSFNGNDNVNNNYVDKNNNNNIVVNS